jgi:23S rRNA (adenine(2503)-C(2))-methyltransferase
MSKDLKDKTLSELEQIVVELGQKKYLAGYIFQFIHNEGATEISRITPLSKAFREKLVQQDYYISQLTVLKKLTDKDGTAKYVFALGDGSRIETVLLLDSPREINLHSQSRQTSVGSNISRGKERRTPHSTRSSLRSSFAQGGSTLCGEQGNPGLPGLPRRTICVSNQVGCPMGCTFCATARLGFCRNLTAAEIVDQVNTVQKDAGRISNVVYMGMGEPLLNYSAAVKSVRILNHPKGKNIGIRHITISTCGIIPAIKKLAGEDIYPRLAVSLNAPTDELRTHLMPINAKYPLAELFKAIRLYQKKTGQRVTFEYVLIKGLNDSDGCVRLLVKLLDGIMCNVNLIEHNPHPGCTFVGSGSARIRQFAMVLERAGIETTVRFRMGRGIKAACGQLGAELLSPT